MNIKNKNEKHKFSDVNEVKTTIESIVRSLNEVSITALTMKTGTIKKDNIIALRKAVHELQASFSENCCQLNCCQTCQSASCQSYSSMGTFSKVKNTYMYDCNCNCNCSSGNCSGGGAHNCYDCYFTYNCTTQKLQYSYDCGNSCNYNSGNCNCNCSRNCYDCYNCISVAIATSSKNYTNGMIFGGW